MNIKGFFVDALSSALELGIGTPDDVVRHVTPDVLATHLPRALWARLFTACLGAPRVDAQLVIETIGIPNLCEHVPSSIIWACINELGARSLGKAVDVPVAPEAVRVTAPAIEARPAVLAPPPEELPAPPPAPSTPVAVGPSIPAPAVVNQPLSDLISELEASDPGSEPRLAKLRPRSPTAERFRQSNTGVGRLTGRRPQAAATPSSPRRSGTEHEPEQETAVSEGADWGRRSNSDVDDSGLVEWKADGAPVDDDFSDLGRKR